MQQIQPKAHIEDQIIVLDPRQELPNISRSLSGNQLIAILDSAETGDTRELFALYRDIISDTQVQSDFVKRKGAVLGDTINMQEIDDKNRLDVQAKDICNDLITNGAFIDAVNHLLNSTLWPVAVAEKVFRYVDGKGYVLSSIIPVHYQLLDYSNGFLRIFDLDPDGKPLSTSHYPDPARYIVHRGHILPIRDQEGGPMRSLLFWWLLRTQSRQWWADLLERFGVPFLKGKYTDEAGKQVLQQAFKLAVRLGAIVVSKNTEVEIVQAAAGDSSNAHERFVELCNREISKLVTGQTLTSSVQATGLGSGTAELHGEVRQDLRKMDGALLSRTLREQLLTQLCQINNCAGRPPNILFGSDSAAELKSVLTMLKELKAAGLEPDDDGLVTLSKRCGFGLRRIQGFQPSFTGFSVDALSTAGRTHTDKIAPSKAGTLADAFIGQLAPLAEIIASSETPDACIRQARAWALSADVKLTTDMLNEILTSYVDAGIRSA
jgi:phage gp29-like protein